MSKRSEQLERRQRSKPNYVKGGKLYLVRCFKCDSRKGRANWQPAIELGYCAWCGWAEQRPEQRSGRSIGLAVATSAAYPRSPGIASVMAGPSIGLFPGKPLD